MNWLMVQEQWENQQMYGFVVDVDDFENEEEVVDVMGVLIKIKCVSE